MLLSHCRQLNNIYSIDLSAGTGTPITTATAKAFLRVTFSDDDTIIASLITQAIQAIEKYCAISIYTRTVTLVGDIYHEFELPYGPVTTFTSAALKSGTTYDAITTPNVDTDGVFARYIPGTAGRIKMVYVAGAYTPDSLVLACLNEIAFRYENRGDDNKIDISPAARVLADPYRRLEWV